MMYIQDLAAIAGLTLVAAGILPLAAALAGKTLPGAGCQTGTEPDPVDAGSLRAHVELRDTAVKGSAQGLLRLGQSATHPIGQVIVTGSAAPDLTDYGVRFENGLPSVPPIIEETTSAALTPFSPEQRWSPPPLS
jgi:hypothetical protein